MIDRNLDYFKIATKEDVECFQYKEIINVIGDNHINDFDLIGT